MPDRVLDHIEPIELSAEKASAHYNELVSLDYLAEGLHFLASRVSEIEERVCAQIEREGSPSGSAERVFMIGNPPDYKWVPLGLLASAFHWYAVSACNYVRLVGWISSGDRVSSAKYVEKVIPQVHVWRNKVAAHFAITSPIPEDTPADLAVSVMFPIGFCNGTYTANPLTLTTHGTSSRDDMSWSLTGTHKKLMDRYWRRDVRNAE